MAAVIRQLTGDVNGVNKIFTAPSPFVAGSFRPIWNGSVYEQGDVRFGCAEDSDTQVTLTIAPLTGEVIQGFYEDAGMVGSPFDPEGVLP